MIDDKPPFVAVSVDKMMAEYGALLKVAETARVAFKVINNHYLKEPPHDEGLWFARDEIDIALKKLDEARRG